MSQCCYLGSIDISTNTTASHSFLSLDTQTCFIDGIYPAFNLSINEKLATRPCPAELEL